MMSNICRRLGANIYAYMREADISLERFAGVLGYSVKDVWNIVEGKVMLSPMELERISAFLHTTKENLLNAKTDSIVPELQFMKEFDDPDNLDKILDLMDEYAEFMEVV